MVCVWHHFKDGIVWRLCRTGLSGCCVSPDRETESRTTEEQTTTHKALLARLHQQGHKTFSNRTTSCGPGVQINQHMEGVLGSNHNGKSIKSSSVDPVARRLRPFHLLTFTAKLEAGGRPMRKTRRQPEKPNGFYRHFTVRLHLQDST